MYKRQEKGLYVCTLDETKNELHLNKHIPTEDFPSYVIKKDDYLYVSLKDARVEMCIRDSDMIFLFKFIFNILISTING